MAQKLNNRYLMDEKKIHRRKSKMTTNNRKEEEMSEPNTNKHENKMEITNNFGGINRRRKPPKHLDAEIQRRFKNLIDFIEGLSK